MRVKDTGRIIHVRLRCIEIRVRTEQFRDQWQHQRRVARTQKLQTSVVREENKNHCQSSRHELKALNQMKTIVST